MTENTEKPKEIHKPREAQPAPEASRRAGAIGDNNKQADWRTTQKAHMLEQDESATDLFYRPGASKQVAQKFELVDSQSQEHHLVLQGRVEQVEHIDQPVISTNSEALTNTPDGWLAAGQRIAGLPLDKQAQIGK